MFSALLLGLYDFFKKLSVKKDNNIYDGHDDDKNDKSSFFVGLCKICIFPNASDGKSCDSCY